MKFSFEISRSQTNTGAVIKSSVAQPGHAAVLRRIPRRRMYDAASTDRLSADFQISQNSANAEILTSAIQARSRARKLERDNPYAWLIIDTHQNNVGGHDPFRLQMHLGKYNAAGEFEEEKETNRQLEAWWKDVGTPENYTVNRTTSRMEAYWQAISAVIRDGGIIWRKWRGFPKNEYGYAVEPIEVDRLDHNYNQPARGTSNKIQFGIETDRWDGPEAFHLFQQHPGDTFAFAPSARYRDRVPADQIIAVWDIRTRAGQVIGMPRFSSIIKRLHREDQWDVAYVTAAIYAACKQIYLKRSLDATEDVPVDQTLETGENIETVEPAVARVLPPGYEAQQLDPKFPMESSSGFKRDNLRAIGAGSGLAYHTVANDLSDVNFSSGRLGEQAQRDGFMKLQNHLIMNLVFPDFSERLRQAINLGMLPGITRDRLKEIVAAAEFNGRRWAYVNPLQDVQADILKVQHGFDSKSHIVAESERGGTFEDVCAEQATDKKTAEVHGLDFAVDPTKPAADEGDEGDPPKPPAKTGGKQTIKSLNGHRHEFAS